MGRKKKITRYERPAIVKLLVCIINLLRLPQLTALMQLASRSMPKGINGKATSFLGASKAASGRVKAGNDKKKSRSKPDKKKRPNNKNNTTGKPKASGEPQKASKQLGVLPTLKNAKAGPPAVTKANTGIARKIIKE